jgi:transposase-like protein
MARGGRRYSAKLKFQVVLEALRGEHTPGQLAKQYGVHANSIGIWKKQLLERGPEVFAQEGRTSETERRVAVLELLSLSGAMRFLAAVRSWCAGLQLLGSYTISFSEQLWRV